MDWKSSSCYKAASWFGVFVDSFCVVMVAKCNIIVFTFEFTFITQPIRCFAAAAVATATKTIMEMSVKVDIPALHRSVLQRHAVALIRTRSSS